MGVMQHHTQGDKDVIDWNATFLMSVFLNRIAKVMNHLQTLHLEIRDDWKDWEDTSTIYESSKPKGRMHFPQSANNC
jgi:hypothetical protein